MKAIKGQEKKERTKREKKAKIEKIKKKAVENIFERLKIVLYLQRRKPGSYSTQNSNAMKNLARTFCMLLDSKVSKSCFLVSFFQDLSRQDTLSRLEINIIRFLSVKLGNHFLLPLTRLSSD